MLNVNTANTIKPVCRMGTTKTFRESNPGHKQALSSLHHPGYLITSERKVQKTECVSYQTLSKLFCVFQNSIGHEFTETNWNAPLEFVGNNSSWKRTGKVLLANFRKISSRVTDIKGKFSNFSSCVQGLLKSWGFHVMGKKNNNIKTKTSGFKYTSGYQISPYTVS